MTLSAEATSHSTSADAPSQASPAATREPPGSVPLDAILAVVPLSIVPDGDEFLVGDPQQREYVLLPQVGVRVIELLQTGRTLGSIVAEIGPDVDVLEFVATLLELGFVSSVPTAPGEHHRLGPTRVAKRVPPGLV